MLSKEEILQKGERIKNIDPQIRDLVFYLNHIPESSTATTCQGHYPYCKMWPAKEGWIHLFTEDKGIINIFENFTKKYSFVTLNDFGAKEGPYTLFANYPWDRFNRPTEGPASDLFHFLATDRRKQIRFFWKDLTEEVKKYVKTLDQEII